MNELDHPLIVSAYLCAKHFGWTIPQINNLTPAQLDTFVHLLKKDVAKS